MISCAPRWNDAAYILYITDFVMHMTWHEAPYFKPIFWLFHVASLLTKQRFTRFLEAPFLPSGLIGRFTDGHGYFGDFVEESLFEAN
jgi:hypothetical protein